MWVKINTNHQIYRLLLYLGRALSYEFILGLSTISIALYTRVQTQRSNNVVLQRTTPSSRRLVHPDLSIQTRYGLDSAAPAELVEDLVRAAI